MSIFAWHVHHDTLTEGVLGSIEERIAYIKEFKPASEQETRLRLLKPVQGTLPREIVKARAAYVKARAAYDKARAAYDKALIDHREEIEALHKEECPSCPWNGSTILKAEA